MSNPAYQSTSVSALRSFNSFDPRSLPDSCPVEMRSRIISSQQFSTKAKEARQRLLNICLS
jgi:hypothetical protein